MTPQKNSQAKPLCKLGPGGDFVTVWQPQPSSSSGPSNHLVKFLTSTVEIVTMLLGLNRNSPCVGSKSAYYFSECVVCQKEEATNAVSSSNLCSTIDPAPATITEDTRPFSREPMLFPDHSGIGVRTKHKPKHRVRTRSRAAKKRLALRLSEQSSLFELGFKSAKTA